MENEKITASKAFRYLSPCVLVSLFCVFMVSASVVEFEKSGGWSMIGLIMFLPALLVFLCLDYFIKSSINDNTVLLWVIEMIITLIGGGIFYYCFFR